MTDVAMTASGPITDATASDHVYEVIWEPGMITFGVDGAAVAQFTKADMGANWPGDLPFVVGPTGDAPYLIVSTAFQGGEWGGMPVPTAATDAAATPPNHLDLALVRVRVYQ